jgi:transposase InsO family protein
MKLHANAALSLKGRRELCRRVVSGERTVSEAAAAAEVSVRCARKWVGRYRGEGEAGLLDRSSAPRSIPHRTSEQRVQAIAALRRLRFTGPEIAECLGMAVSTVSAILKRVGMGKLCRVGLEAPQRYERARPGELIHVDIKQFGRIEGGAGYRFTNKRRDNHPQTDAAGRRRRQVRFEHLHVAIDDCTRLGYAEVLPDQKAITIIGFLKRTIAFYKSHGITVEQLLTDNGSGYRSAILAIACKTLAIRHLHTRPYRPQTNGKAERFIRTLTDSWAYGQIYHDSTERTAALDPWLHHYNHHRKHSALGHKPPIARLHERQNQPT